MSRSIKHSICGKAENTRDMKKYANRKVRRILKRNLDYSPRGKEYKRLFCSYDICDWRNYVDKNFEQYYIYEVNEWINRRNIGYFIQTDYPTKKEAWRKWLKWFLIK